METMELVTYEQCQEAANFIKEKTCTTTKVAVVCGLSGLAKNIEDAIVIPYTEIPNFPHPSTSTNGLAHLVYGKLAGTSVMFMKGRFHFYEGYSIQQCTMIIRVLQLLGIEILIVTSSSAAINEDYKVGDFLLVTDHINMMGLLGTNPLIGKNDERWGPRFMHTKDSYEKVLLAMSREILQEAKYEGTVREGTYAITAGPTYKTQAEQYMFLTLGADAIGMSIVPEVLVAKHCGMSVIAMSLIINQAPCDDISYVEELNQQEIAIVEDTSCADLRPFFEKFILACEHIQKAPAPPSHGGKGRCHCLRKPMDSTP